MQLNIEIFSELPDFSSSRAKWDMQTSSFRDQMEIQEPRILTWKVKLTICLFRCKNYETVITKLFLNYFKNRFHLPIFLKNSKVKNRLNMPNQSFWRAARSSWYPISFLLKIWTEFKSNFRQSYMKLSMTC